jgi:hypothetical protein
MVLGRPHPCERRTRPYAQPMHRLVFAILALLAAMPAAAQTLTAGALAAMCTSQTQASACGSYIQGYIDGRNQSLARPTVCVPAGTSPSNVAAAFVAHIAGNRLEANIQAGLVLGNHLVSTYPCR